MGITSVKASKSATAIKILQDYDVAADAKNRISLRGAKTKYFNVKALSNGCYVLEPRVLVSPDKLPTDTPNTTQSVAARRVERRAEADGSFYDQALPILKKSWEANRRLPRDLATNPKYMDGFGE
jgi:hypothetical protein